MSILAARLQPPTLPEWVLPRPRLLGRVLGRAPRLVVLHAPAGSGKSMLAAQACAAWKGRVAWLHLDPGDASAPAFCRGLARAFEHGLPELRGTELVALADDRAVVAETWIEDVALCFAELVHSPALLVLDNFESVADEPAIHGLLDRLVSARLANLRLLVASRVRPRLRLRRLVEGGEALLLGADELAFGLDEFRRAAEARRLDLPADRLEDLWSRSGGWCVSLGLAATGRSESGPRRSAAATEYLDEEILSGLPPDLRSFLVETSVLEVLSAPGAAALGVDAPTFERRLEEVRRLGLPHLPAGDGAVRLHPLVHDRLLAELQAHPDAAARERLARDAARFHHAEGRTDQAVRLFAGLDLHEVLLDFLDAEWPELIARDLVPRVKDWMALLPASFDRHPKRLRFLSTSFSSSGDNARLAALHEELRRAGVDRDLYRRLPGLWTSAAWGRVLIATGERYRELVREWREFEAGVDARARFGARRSLAVAALYELRYEDAARIFQEELDAMTVLDADRISLIQALAIIRQERGFLQEAGRGLEECLRLSNDIQNANMIALSLSNLASIRKEEGRFAEACVLGDRALEIGRARNVAYFYLISHVARVRGEALWQMGRPREALAELAESYDHYRRTSHHEALATGATLDHFRGLLGEASSLVSERDFVPLPHSEAHIRFLIRCGRQGDRQRDRSAAGSNLARARRLAREMPHWRATAWLTEALVFAGPEPARSRRALRSGLALLERDGRVTYPLADAVLTAWVVAEAVATRTYPERALALAGGETVVDLRSAFEQRLAARGTTPIEARRLVAAATKAGVRGLGRRIASLTTVPAATRDAYAAAAGLWALPPIFARLLGSFAMTILGEEVRFTRKASRGILQLLLLEHPRAIHEDVLAETFWGRLGETGALRSLRTAVADLRRALDPPGSGRSYVVHRNGQYGLELPGGSFVDVHEFRKEVARLAGSDGAPIDAAHAAEWERALALYRDDLLVDEPYAAHAAEPRERLRSLFLSRSERVARAWATSDAARAHALLERGLALDPLWAEGVLLRIEILRREGRVLAALRTFRDYETRLRRDLGVPPQPALLRQYGEMTRGT